ncbi:MAG: hypothetical protein F6K63_31335 [Moorea sp. SIO1G6]|uniref:aspartyl/asparaginyl beta-hydroxylase domain-containing protein n=1 Tax=Moorena sp. SIO1G6 TaxID=2607840 RepID=UPI0013BFBFC8|nr:aspartyl/asparaginyl beta-hydroxylase domain-containing protein [Moorena sp. SIO1G6]NES81685.1 hypothetical protein [Moorena sp. SIO2B7]NET68648.1 hypothetical protein [Moorena sp. SIO1G6]
MDFRTFSKNLPYPEDAFGIYLTYPLWNHQGDSRNGNTYHYNGIPKITDIGNTLSHISAMITDTFNVNFLKVCRINEFLSGTFIVPHVDYLDGCQSSEKFFRRIHIPLKTQKESWNYYEAEVYHMQFGEIWLHDSYCCHSAGNFSSESRFHLILDVDPTIPLDDLFKDKAVFNSSHKLDPISREPFTNSDLNNILDLAKIINHLNFKEIVSLLSKIHFYKKVSSALTYDWLEKIAKNTKNRQLI